MDEAVESYGSAITDASERARACAEQALHEAYDEELWHLALNRW